MKINCPPQHGVQVQTVCTPVTLYGKRRSSGRARNLSYWTAYVFVSGIACGRAPAFRPTNANTIRQHMVGSWLQTLWIKLGPAVYQQLNYCQLVPTDRHTEVAVVDVMLVVAQLGLYQLQCIVKWAGSRSSIAVIYGAWVAGCPPWVGIVATKSISYQSSKTASRSKWSPPTWNRRRLCWLGILMAWQ